MSRLRVLHVGKFYPPHHGGMESHLETLCRELRAEVDVEVLVSADGRRPVRETIDGVPVTRIGTLATLASAPRRNRCSTGAKTAPSTRWRMMSLW